MAPRHPFTLPGVHGPDSYPAGHRGCKGHTGLSLASGWQGSDPICKRSSGRAWPAEDPTRFSEYLELCNGFQGANFLLLGTNPMALAGDYVEPSVFAATQQAIRDEFIDRMSLVLGRSYSVLTYHSQKKQYVLLDDHSGQEFEIVPDLVAFVDYMNGIARQTLAERKYPHHSSG